MMSQVSVPYRKIWEEEVQVARDTYLSYVKASLLEKVLLVVPVRAESCPREEKLRNSLCEILPKALESQILSPTDPQVLVRQQIYLLFKHSHLFDKRARSDLREAVKHPPKAPTRVDDLRQAVDAWKARRTELLQMAGETLSADETVDAITVFTSAARQSFSKEQNWSAGKGWDQLNLEHNPTVDTALSYLEVIMSLTTTSRVEEKKKTDDKKTDDKKDPKAQYANTKDGWKGGGKGNGKDGKGKGKDGKGKGKGKDGKGKGKDSKGKGKGKDGWKTTGGMGKETPCALFKAGKCYHGRSCKLWHESVYGSNRCFLCGGDHFAKECTVAPQPPQHAGTTTWTPHNSPQAATAMMTGTTSTTMPTFPPFPYPAGGHSPAASTSSGATTLLTPGSLRQDGGGLEAAVRAALMRVLADEAHGVQAKVMQLTDVVMMMARRHRSKQSTFDSGASNVMVGSDDELHGDTATRPVSVTLADGGVTASMNDYDEVKSENCTAALMSMGRVVAELDAEITWSQRKGLCVAGPGFVIHPKVENYVPMLSQSQFDYLRQQLRRQQRDLTMAAMSIGSTTKTMPTPKTTSTTTETKEKERQLLDRIVARYRHASDAHTAFDNTCPKCIRGSARSRQHRTHQRRLWLSTGELCIDVSGPHVTDPEGNNYTLIGHWRRRNLEDEDVIKQMAADDTMTAKADDVTTSASAAGVTTTTDEEECAMKEDVSSGSFGSSEQKQQLEPEQPETNKKRGKKQAYELFSVAMKSKPDKELLEAMLTIMAEIAQRGGSVHSVYGDQAFMTGAIKKKLRDSCIGLSASATEDAAANGRAERAVGLCKELGRRNLAATLPDRFWSYAVNHAAQELSRQDGDTLLPFGSTVLAISNSAAARKSWERGQDGVYLGRTAVGRPAGHLVLVNDRVQTYSTVRKMDDILTNAEQEKELKKQGWEILKLHNEERVYRKVGSEQASLFPPCVVFEEQQISSSVSSSPSSSSLPSSSSSSSSTTIPTTTTTTTTTSSLPKTDDVQYSCAACRGQHKTHVRDETCRLQGVPLARSTSECGACRGRHIPHTWKEGCKLKDKEKGRRDAPVARMMMMTTDEMREEIRKLSTYCTTTTTTKILARSTWRKAQLPKRLPLRPR